MGKKNRRITLGDEASLPQNQLKNPSSNTEGLQPSSHRRNYWIGFAILGLSTFGVYLATLYPGIPGGDSGELSAAICQTGVAHPPGYPLYIILAKAFNWIISFFTSHPPAWGINLFSAFCNTLAALTLYSLVVLVTGNPWAALSGAGLFAFSPIVWEYSTVGEVFALNNLFSVLLLYVGFRFRGTGSVRWAALGAFLFGLGLCNHHTIVFIGGPIAIACLWVLSKREGFAKNFVLLSGMFLLGLLPYAYLPFAASRFPMINWGENQTLGGFFRHLTRADFGTFQLFHAGTGSGFWANIWLYWNSLLKQTLYIGPVFLIAWIFHALSEKNRQTRLRSPWNGLLQISIGLYLVYMIVFHLLSNLPLEDPTTHNIFSRFWQLPNLLIFGWIGIALAVLAKSSEPKYTKPILGGGLLAVILQILVHYPAHDRHLNTIVQDYGRAHLLSLPSQAVLFTRGDIQINPIWYLQNCEGFRKDVVIIDRSLLTYPWYRKTVSLHYPQVVIPPGEYQRPGGYSLADLFLANISRMPIFMSEQSLEEKQVEPKLPGFQEINFGLIDQVLPEGASVNLADYAQSTDLSFKAVDPVQLQKYRELSWEKVIWVDYWTRQNAQALYVITEARKAKNAALLAQGVASLDRMIQHVPDVTPQVLKNAGLAHSHLLELDPSRNTSREKLVQYWKEFLNKTPDSDPDHQIIEKTLAQFQQVKFSSAPAGSRQ